MGERLENILKKPQFDKVSKERKEELLELSEKLKGKGSMESMGIINSFIKKRVSEGEETPRPEQEAMAEALLESLSDADRARFRGMLKMAKNLEAGS